MTEDKPNRWLPPPYETRGQRLFVAVSCALTLFLGGILNFYSLDRNWRMVAVNIFSVGVGAFGLLLSWRFYRSGKSEDTDQREE